MYAIYRQRQTKTNTIIVHRRVGRARVKSMYDIAGGWRGKWKTVCSAWTTSGVNVTTKVEQVTCMRCLKRMGETERYESQKQQIAA